MKGKNKDTSEKHLSFPHLTSFDHAKNCPRYSSILTRADGEGVGIEEMDNLQMELETMLVNVMQRARQLKMESMILDNLTGSDLNESLIITAPTKSVVKTGPTSSAAEKTSTLNKKSKSFSGKSNLFSPVVKQNTNKETGPIVRNEIPDIFWKSVEPYCADITEEDIKFLEKQIEINDEYLLLSNVEPIGSHYAFKWTNEDMEQQTKESSRLMNETSTPTKKRKGNQIEQMNTSLTRSPSASLIHAKLKKYSQNPQQNVKDSVNYGALTQRLISSLIEQNLMTPFESNDIVTYLEKLTSKQPTQHNQSTLAMRNSLLSSCSNSNVLEKKLKKSLIEQGLIDEQADKLDAIETRNGQDDVKNHQDNDEIANEIKNLQNELKIVSNQCKQSLNNLLRISKQTLNKQELKKRIKTIDEEIVELHEKFKTNRLAKKHSSKKERDRAHWLIKEREKLSSQVRSTEIACDLS